MRKSFLHTLALTCGLGAFIGGARGGAVIAPTGIMPELPNPEELPRGRRPYRRTFNKWHQGTRDHQRLIKREENDTRAAMLNYEGWCGLSIAGAAHNE